MNLRYVVGTVIIVLLCTVFGCKRFQMRKEIPSQEIIRLEKGIAVVNGENEYLQENLEVVLNEPNGMHRRLGYNANGACLFDGLEIGRTYRVDIKRTDLKGKLLYRTTSRNVSLTGVRDQYYVLIGASIGKAWEFQKLPAILKLDPGIVFGDRACYQFDKTKEIKRLVGISPIVSGVIVKECASYFPRDIPASKQSIETWIFMLRQAGIKPFLATVVPVTPENEKRNPGRLQSIVEYNVFIRDFAAHEQIAVLDLENALRINENERFLRAEYAQEDGLHLVPKAYTDVLNGLIVPLIFQKKP